MTALGEVAGELASVLRPVVHDVRDDQPTRRGEVLTRGEAFGQRREVEGRDVLAQTEVLLDAERVDRGQVLEGDVVPRVGLAYVMSDAELPPAPVDIDEMTKRLERAVMIEHPASPELFIGELARCLQDLVVRPGME